MDKIELKVKKLLAMINDHASTENEKLIATNVLNKIKEKYPDLEFGILEEEETRHEIRTGNKYERSILISILVSYGLDAYTTRNHSKLKIIFTTTQTLFELIKDEYDYHNIKINIQLDAVLAAYIHQFIKDPEACGGREATKEEIEAYSNARSFFRTQDFYIKKRIEA